MADHELKISLPIVIDEAQVKLIREAAAAIRELQGASRSGGGGGGGASGGGGAGGGATSGRREFAGIPSPADIAVAKKRFNELIKSRIATAKLVQAVEKQSAAREKIIADAHIADYKHGNPNGWLVPRL